MASEERKPEAKKSENLLNNDADIKTTEPSPSVLRSDAPAPALLPAEVHRNDIVFGRGKGYHGHHGNERMREIIDRYKMRYHAIDRSQKRELVELVYQEIVHDGARFLVKASSGDGYEEADRTMAIQKVSNALRCKKSFQREAASSSSPRRKSASLSAAENDSVAGSLPYRPLHEGLSSAIPGAGGLTSLESLILSNNHSNNNLYQSTTAPWNLGGAQSLRGDILPTSAAMGAGALSLSAALRSDLTATREPAVAHRNLALGITNPSSILPYATIPGGQPSLDPVATLLRQELLLQQLGVAGLGSPRLGTGTGSLGSTRLATGSITNDLSNRLIMEELLSPSRAMRGSSVGDSMTNKKNPQQKDSGI